MRIRLISGVVGLKNRRPGPSILSILLLASVLIHSPGAANGQSLPGFFERFDPPYVNPCNPNDPGLLVVGSNLEVNRDGSCDGTREATYPIPVGLQTASVVRLTPTRDLVYAQTGSCVGGTEVQFYRLPVTNGDPVTLITTVCVQPAIAQFGFYDTGISQDPPGTNEPTPDALLGVSSQRIAFIATSTGPPNPQQIIWVDMNTGDQSFPSAFNFNRIVDIVKVSPSGTQALVRHGVLAGQTPDYNFVNLCPGEVGMLLNMGGLVDIGGNPLDAEATNLAGGTLDIEVTQDGNPITTFQDVIDCLAGVPPPTGACCDGAICTDNVSAVDCTPPSVFFPGGSCTPDPCQQPAPEACCFSNGTCQDLAPADCTSMGGTPQGPGSSCATLMPFCPPPAGTRACCLPDGSCFNVTVATCVGFLGGVPQGAGTNCFDPNGVCPMAALSLSKTAPATVAEGELFTYTLTYANGGPDSANGVVVAETLPVGAIFVSAGNTPGGAAPTVAGSLISWPVGTLIAGAVNQQVTVTVRAGCNTPNNQITNSVYSITGTPGGTVNGAAVVTNVTPAPQNPVLITVSSVDLNGPPLKADELVEHTITLTNTAAVTHHGVSVNGQAGGDVDAGFASAFEAAVNSAGGTFIVNPNNLRFRWEGDLGPSAVINIVFTTRVDSCIPVTRDIETLNRGNPITVCNPCNVQLGSTTPTDVFSLVRPIEAELVALNLAQPGGATTVAARAGATIQFEMRLIEQCNTNHPNVNASLVIPAGITPDPLADPLINPPAGASYDSGTQTISYAGPINAGQTLFIRWNGILDIGGPCPVDLMFSGSVDACSNIERSLRILAVPVLPTGPYIIGLSPNEGLWLFEPDVPFFNQLLCLPGETLTGLGRTPSGEIWVTGVNQIIRFNPETNPPEIEFFGGDFLLNELGIDNPGDVAFDPTTPAPSLIIVGTDRFFSIGSVRRYTPSRPAGQRVDVILDDPQLQTLVRVAIDPEGMIAAIGDNALIRIDPTAPLPLAPGDYAQFDLTIDSDFNSQPGTRFPATPVNLSLDRDGDYLLTVGTAFTEDFGTPLALPLRLTSFYSLAKVDRTSGTVGVPTGTPSTIVELLGGTVLCFGACPPNPPPADFSGALFGGLDMVRFRGSAFGPACDIFLGGEQFPGLLAIHRSTNPVSSSPFPLPSPGVDLEFVNIGTASILGDMNCDCALNLLDVGPFVQALTDPAGYAAAFANCDINNADLNGDGNRDGLDIQDFVASLVP